jgi:hypothetical protein
MGKLARKAWAQSPLNKGTHVQQAEKTIRAVALFDLAATLPLAIPIFSGYWLALLFSGFGLAGSPSDHLPMPQTTLLFCNLAGILGVLWNGARFMRPERSLTRMDVRGRILVALMLVYYLGWQGLPAVLWLFVASEIIGAVLQHRALKVMRQHRAVVD